MIPRTLWCIHRLTTHPGHVLLVLCLLLWWPVGNAADLEPCTPFAQGRVDIRLVKIMQNAAHEGRLFRVDPEMSTVSFCVQHFPLQEYRGTFSNIVGGLTLPPALDQYGQALMLIHTTEMVSNDPDLDEIVLGHQFINSEQFPEILFIGRAFQWYTPLQGYIYGDLTVRGKTRPVIIQVEIRVLESDQTGKLQRIHLSGIGHVNRREFGMLNHRLMVSEDVRLCLSVELALWQDQQ